MVIWFLETEVPFFHGCGATCPVDHQLCVVKLRCATPFGHFQLRIQCQLLGSIGNVCNQLAIVNHDD